MPDVLNGAEPASFTVSFTREDIERVVADAARKLVADDRYHVFIVDLKADDFGPTATIVMQKRAEAPA
jgi:hypothetical protein